MNQLELTDWLRQIASEVKSTRLRFPRNVVPGCPIPFFGNILNPKLVPMNRQQAFYRSAK